MISYRNASSFQTAHTTTRSTPSPLSSMSTIVPSTGNAFNSPLNLSNSLNKGVQMFGTSLTDMASANKRAWKGWGL